MLRQRREWEARKQLEFDTLREEVHRLWDAYRQEMEDEAAYCLDAMEYHALREAVPGVPPVSSHLPFDALEELVEHNLRRTLDDTTQGLQGRYQQDLNEGRIVSLRVRHDEEVRKRREAFEQEEEHRRCQAEARVALSADQQRDQAVTQQQQELAAADSLKRAERWRQDIEERHTRDKERFELEWKVQDEKGRALGRTANALDSRRVATEAELLKGRRLHAEQDAARREAEAARQEAVQQEHQREREMLFGQVGWEQALEQRLAEVVRREQGVQEAWGRLHATRESELAKLARDKDAVNSMREHSLALKKAFVAMHPVVTRLCKHSRVDLGSCKEWQNFVSLHFDATTP